MSTRLFPLALCALALLAPLGSEAAAQQVLRKTYDGRRCRVYIPSTYRQGTPRPLVVMLHGCTQDPEDFARGTRFDEVAEREGLIVLYPEQPSSANQNKCWNWFEPAHQARGRGEPASIVACVEGAAREWSVDRERVYAAGLSAGAAMSSILAATYPDVFAAVGVHSGLQYAAARDVGGAFSAMFGSAPDPERGARDVLRAMGPRKRAMPVIVFHGTGDSTVRPQNGVQVARQFAQVADLALDGRDSDQVPSRPSQTQNGNTPGGLAYAIFDHLGPSGRTWIRRYEVTSMGHAWSGGDRAGSYTDPAGPNASEALWAFFAQHSRSGSASAPAPAPVTPAPAPVTPAPTPIAPTPITPVTPRDTTPPTLSASPPAGSYPPPSTSSCRATSPVRSTTPSTAARRPSPRRATPSPCG